MAVYRNVSGDERFLVEIGTGRVHRVADGDTVEVTDEASVKGLVGQESIWEPVPPAQRVKG